LTSYILYGALALLSAVMFSALSLYLGLGTLFMLGVLVGVFVGSTLTIAVCLNTFNSVATNQTTLTKNFIQKWVSPKTVYVANDPMLLAHIKALTDHAVAVDNFCGVCSHHHPEMHKDPFNPRYHLKSCPVSFARYDYRRTVVRNKKNQRKNRQETETRALQGAAPAILSLPEGKD